MNKFHTNLPYKEMTEKYYGPRIPAFPAGEWVPLSKVTGTEQTETYFIIHTVAGDRPEELFICLPKEGGVRIQSLHEVQKQKGITAPVANNAGELEPSALMPITYETDGDAVVLTGTDGTTARFTVTAEGFLLTISGRDGEVISVCEKQILYKYDGRGNVLALAVQMPIREDEGIIGGGERFNGCNQVGRAFSMTNVDSPSTTEYTYTNIALYHSNQGYSIWVNISANGQSNFEIDDATKYAIMYKESNLDMYLWAGTPLENLKKYTDITGTSGVTEKWTYGFWTGAAAHAFITTKKKDEFENLKDLLEGYKEHYNFYPEACYGEGSNSGKEEPIKYSVERGVRMFTWLPPENAHPRRDLGEILGEEQFPAYDENGNIVSTGWPYPHDEAYKNNFGIKKFSQESWWDLSNPSVKTVLKEVLGQKWDWGVNGSMLDYGDCLPYEGVCYNGMSAEQMHNFGPYYCGKMHHEIWTERFGNDYVLFQRAGTAGSQKYTGNFLGDQFAHWDHYIRQVYSAVNFGACGFNLYGGDLGALMDRPSNDIWNRWVTLVTFMPFMRKHGTNIHFPWCDYGALAAKTFGHYYYFRKNIVPTVMSAAMDANKTSNPIMKGMIMAYPKQTPLKDVHEQYLFCDDFLVCPVTYMYAHCEQVALPKGSTWYDLYSYKTYKGGQVMDAEAPTSTMPVFVKGGAVKAIELTETLELGDEIHEDTAHPALLITAPDTAHTVTIYVKDGVSKDYQTYDSHTETYENTPTDGAVFTVFCAEGSPRQIVTLLGTVAAGVSVDGKPLTRLDHKPSVAENEYGYYVDRKGKTLMVLPAGWKQLAVTKGDAGYQPLPMTADGDAAALVDGDVTTTCVLPEDGTCVEAQLCETTAIDRIVVKWAAGYCSDYDVQYSADGENWKTIEQRGRCGAVNVLDIHPAQVKYLRVIPITKGDADPAPAIYALEVYAADTGEVKVLQDVPVSQDESWAKDEFKDWRTKVIERSGERKFLFAH